MIFWRTPQITLHNGDSLDVLSSLPDESVNCVVTSPPYWGLRDYGVEGQLGLEKTPEEYVSKMVKIFEEVRRVLRKDGTAWVNMGDCYSGSGKGMNGDGSVGKHGEKQHTNTGANISHIESQETNLKPKDLVGMPWRLAFALQSAGWYLRQDIIWSKPNPMPESVTDRCTKAHEYIFLLTKSAKYYYNQESILEPITNSSFERLSQTNIENQVGSYRVPFKTNGPMKAVGRGGKNSLRGQGSNRTGENGTANRDGRDMKEVGAGLTRNRRSVWTVATQPFSEAHFATFPETLIEPCILAGCPAGGVVLDPFFGAGTTGLVALKLGRRAIGIELNPDYCEMAKHRLEPFESQLQMII